MTDDILRPSRVLFEIVRQIQRGQRQGRHWSYHLATTEAMIAVAGPIFDEASFFEPHQRVKTWTSFVADVRRAMAPGMRCMVEDEK